MRTLAPVALLAGLALLVAAGCQATVRGTGGKSLTVVAPLPVTIHRGETKLVQVGVKREKISEGVRVSLSNLPAGVTAKEESKTVETDAATFVLEASKTADLVANHAVMATVQGPEGMRASKNFHLTVKE